MTREQWRTAWRIFNIACQIPAEERKPFIESESADAEIVSRVFELLESKPEVDEPAPTPVPVQRTGTQVGRYQVGELLGRGGMGEVYAARDTDLGRDVALKFLRPETMVDPFAVQRFVREAKAASALNHPNIMTIYEVIHSSSGLAIAMELISGRPLNEFRGSALSIAQVVEFGRQAASALAAAHERGIVHRDIKPENLMLRPDGFVKVLDFGLARDVDGKFAATFHSSSSGLPAGTLCYMSPEQLRGEPVTRATDVFSLGIVLYELAAGRHPFESPHPLETVAAMHLREPAPLSAANPDPPQWLDELLASMLKRDPALRPDARHVAEVLSMRAVGSRHRSRPAWNYGAIVAVLLVLTVAAAVPLALRHRPAVSSRAAGSLRTVPLTGLSGMEIQPAFSPDGKQVVYARRDADYGPFDLYVKLIGGGPPLRLPAGRPENTNPSWSPDGTQIAFFRSYPDHAAVMTMAALGGAEKLVGRVSDVTSQRQLTWRPDQKALIVCDRAHRNLREWALWALPLDGSPRERLTDPPPGYTDLSPAFSPDGKILAFLRRIGNRTEIYLREEPGAARRLTFEDKHMESLAWAADGRSILFQSRRPIGRTVWRVSVSGGAPERVPEIGADPIHLAIARQGDELAYVRNPAERSDILKLDMSTTSRKTVKVTNSTGMDVDPVYSPDGQRIAFASSRAGSNEIWVVGVDGSNPVPLTSLRAPITGSPRWSPDGTQLVFDSRFGDKEGIFVVNASGGQPRRLPVEGILPAWSQDGRWIYFAKHSDKDQIWKVPAAGGPAIQVTRNGGWECFESPDGRFLFYTKPDGTAGVWRMPVAGGEETEIRELRPIAGHRYWTVNRTGVYFLDMAQAPNSDHGMAALKRYRFSTSRVELVSTPVPPIEGGYHGLAVSPDERSYLWVQPGPSIYQIMLVEGFR